jgi:hypothetical protein
LFGVNQQIVPGHQRKGPDGNNATHFTEALGYVALLINEFLRRDVIRKQKDLVNVSVCFEHNERRMLN